MKSTGRDGVNEEDDGGGVIGTRGGGGGQNTEPTESASRRLEEEEVAFLDLCPETSVTTPYLRRVTVGEGAR